MMTKKLALLIALGAASPALGAPAGGFNAPVGDLDTLQIGTYICGVPGDASAAAVKPIAEQGFKVVTGSSYETNVGRGTYLMTGKSIVMTSGPKKGQRFRQISDRFLHEVNDAGDTDLRCVLRNRNNR